MLSIVIRGKIFPNITQKVVDSIRSWHQGELILSTWNNQEVNLTGIDTIILSDDPGSGPVQQANRQLLSYLRGLQACSNDLVLVTRSDIIHNSDIQKFFYNKDDRLEKFSIFKEKVVVSNMMTINPLKSHPDVPTFISKLFRVCDWFQLGLKEDLFKWVDALDTFETYKNSGLCTEQLWFTSLIKKYKDSSFPIENIVERSKEVLPYIISNFRIIDMKSTGNAINLNWVNQPEYLGCYFTEKEYNEYCSSINRIH